MTEPRISIIIAFYKDEKHLSQCVERCLELDYTNYEIIVSAHKPPACLDRQVKFILVESESQATKKDAGVRNATGEVCAFIDDDAYPRRDWLSNAIKYLEDASVAAVCGPGVTPNEDTALQKASGVVYCSLLGAGPLRFRYLPSKKRYVKEFAGYNVLIRRSVLLESGLFGNAPRSGEDSILSERLGRLGKKIIYAPDVVCYHHRRPLFRAHLRQVFNYAYHRGFFSIHSLGQLQNSSLIAPISVLGMLAALALVTFRVPMLAALLAMGYGASCLLSCLAVERNLKIASVAALAIPLTHITYTSGFVKGAISRNLGERPSY